MSRPRNEDYVVRLIGVEDEPDLNDANVDVIVDFTGGRRYVATFFTVQNLRSLMARYEQTGECANGLYVWSTHMIVITRITQENVEHAVADLLSSGEFDQAFEGPVPVD
jgi:hypothetical protein